MRKWSAMLNYIQPVQEDKKQVERMTDSFLFSEGKKDDFINHHCILSGVSLYQEETPYRFCYHNKEYVVYYDGTLYNAKELRKELIQAGYTLQTDSEAEVFFYSYITYHTDCVRHFNGVFSLIIASEEEAFIARDPIGVKSLYYYRRKDGVWLFSCAIKAILAEKSYQPVLDMESFMEMMTIGPSLSSENTFYKGIYMIPAGSYLYMNSNQLKQVKYYDYVHGIHTDSLEDTIEKVRYLLSDAIKRQSDVKQSLLSFLSGGLDSAIVTKVAMTHRNDLSTYSLDYEGNDKYFSGYSYQTSRDNDYIDLFIKENPIKNTMAIMSQEDLAATLRDAMFARDGIGMADVDSSLLWLCQQASKEGHIVLTGECADEVFLGYPWFYRKELLYNDSFPWITEQENRLSLLNTHFSRNKFMDYGQHIYRESLKKVVHHPYETKEEYRIKEIQYLCFHYFMQTLLSRMDAMGTYAKIEARVPFADIRLVNYVYNIPHEWLFYKDQEKGLLRKAFADILPREIVYRKKNPFPKTHNPYYTELVSELLKEEVEENPLMSYLFDEKQLLALIESKGSSFSTPWFGQLMKGPQLMAFLYQFSRWLKEYHIKVEC